MQTKSWLSLFALLGLAMAILACGPSSPTPTSIPPTPYVAPPLATESPIPPATEAPTEPPASMLPSGTVALYTSGEWESWTLYALGGDLTVTSLGTVIPAGAVASRSGQWIAYPTASHGATTVIIARPDGTVVHTVTAPVGADPSAAGVMGMAFDRSETRLAFLGVGGPAAEGTPWSITVVNLADGSMATFDATTGADGSFLPGNPFGWAAGDGELLIDRFPPYSEGVPLGIWAFALPPGAPAGPLSSRAHRELLASGSYASPARLSPDGTRLLYTARDPAYTPAGYEVMMMDLAVNQLWSLDIASGASSMLFAATDGSALGHTAAWSPDGAQVLYAQGNYAGPNFGSLTLKLRDSSGVVREIGPLPLLPGGYFLGLDWCAPNMALARLATSDFTNQLYAIRLSDGGVTLLASDGAISVLSCIP